MGTVTTSARREIRSVTGAVKRHPLGVLLLLALAGASAYALVTTAGTEQTPLRVEIVYPSTTLQPQLPPGAWPNNVGGR